MARPDLGGTVHAGHRLCALAGLDPVPAAVRLATGCRVRHVPRVLWIGPRAQVGATRSPGRRRARGQLLGATAVGQCNSCLQDTKEAAIPG